MDGFPRETKMFFDRLAPGWDAREKPEVLLVIEKILDRFGVSRGDRVLDVGCGTGILFPPLNARGIAVYAGIDISDGMISEFRRKFPGEKAIAADFLADGVFGPGEFTKIIIYNAYPHFFPRDKVFWAAFGCLVSGGSLCIAHSINRAELDAHHKRAGKEVESHMLEADSVIRMYYENAGFADVEVENGEFFFSRGVKPA